MALQPDSFSSSINPLPQYPMPMGVRKALVVELGGPSEYELGYDEGHVIDAQQFGMGFIDGVMPLSESYSGTYLIRPRATTVDAAPSANLGAGRYYYLRWYTISTGAEVADETDLSGEKVRVLIIGG